MKTRIIIIGAGGHGKVIADIAIKMNKWASIAFLDDNEEIRETMGIQVIGKISDAYKYVVDSDIFVAIGNNERRENIQDQLEASGADIPILIHPKSVVGNGVEIGKGTVVMAGAIVNPCTIIGRGCIINTGSTIDHDNEIGDFVHISPGAHLAGTVSVGKGSMIGIGSIISNNLNVCCGCKLGAGAVVVKDIIKPGTYIGIPVKKMD